MSALRLAHETGCNLKCTAYEQVAHVLSGSSRWDLLLQLVEQSLEFIPHSSARLLNWRLRALIECENFQRLDNILKDFERAGVQPTRRTYHLLITGHLRNHNVEKAKACLDAMTVAGFPVDASTHRDITAVYRHLGPDATVRAQALEALESADDRSGTVVLNSLLQWSLDARDMPDALRILSRFDPKSIGFGDSAGIAAPIHEQDGDQRTTLFTNSPSDAGSHSSVPPEGRRYPVDIATFGILLKHFSRRGQLDRAVRIINQMYASDITPNDYIIAELIRAHFIAGENSTAVRVFQQLFKLVPIPTSLWREIGLKGPRRAAVPVPIPAIKPSVHIFNALIEYILPLHGLRGMRITLRIMGFAGVPVDANTAFRLLIYLVNEHGLNPREVPVWIARLQPGNNTRPDLRHLNILLTSLLRRERERWTTTWADTREHVRHLRAGIRLPSRPPQRNDISFEHGVWAKLYKLAGAVSSRGIKGDHAYYALRIRFEAVVRMDMEAARATFKEMLKHGLKPNKHHFFALMEGYVLGGDVKAAQNIMDTAIRGGVKPTTPMYTILMYGAARQGARNLATQLFQEMLAAKIRPDVGVVDVLACAHFAVGDTARARGVLIRMWPYVSSGRKQCPQELCHAPLFKLARAFRRLDRMSKETIRLVRVPPRVLRTRRKLDRMARVWQMHKIKRMAYIPRFKRPERKRGRWRRDRNWMSKVPNASDISPSP